MTISIGPICGVQVGVELTEGQIEGRHIGYFLIDVFILRIQCAWFIKNG